MKTLSDETIKAYFLGKLAEPEAEILEIECASNAELSERAQTLERELADEYLRGNLSAGDARLFETNYLITEARRRKLFVAQGLHRIAGETIVPVRESVPASQNSFWQTFFGKKRGLQLAFGAFVLLLAFGAIALFSLRSSVGKIEVAEVKETGSTPTENPSVENPVNPTAPKPDAENRDSNPVSTKPIVQTKETDKDLSSPRKKTSEAKTASIPKNVGIIKPALLLMVKLLPGSLRDEGEQFVTLAPDVKNLTLLLSPAGEPNNYKTYRAVVMTPENGVIFTSPDLKALSFTIAARMLENRTYIISLEGKNRLGEFESIADYTFRIRR
jgi:hypothetical protein